MTFNKEIPVNAPDRSDDHIPMDQLNPPNQDQIISTNSDLLNDTPPE